MRAYAVDFRPARSLQTAQNPLYFCYYSDDRDSPCSAIVRNSEPCMVQDGGGQEHSVSPVSAHAKGKEPSNARRIPRVKGFLSGRAFSPSRVVPRKAGFSCFSSLFFGAEGYFFTRFPQDKILMIF